MKFIKLDLLTLLISLFLFSSCKDSNSIGLEPEGETPFSGTLLDTVTIQSQTVADIPTTTLGLSRYPLGEMHDDLFGKTTASLAMSIGLPVPGKPSTAVVDFRNAAGAVNATIDSAVLVLPYAPNYFYGDSTANYDISVSQLSSNLTLNTGFLSNKEYASDRIVGNFSGKLRPHTKPTIMSLVTGAADTAIKVIPQIRIKLDPVMIKDQLVALDSATLSTIAKLNAAFKGLKLNATVTTGKGGMMFLDFSQLSDSTMANISVYYKQPNATTPAKIDTLIAKFPINSATATPVAATIKHDYTGTDVETQLANATVAYDRTYLQSMSGLRNKITFPYLKDLVAKVGTKMVITRAELVVDTYNPADSIPFKIAPVLTLYKHDIANQRVQIQDNNPYSQTNQNGDMRPYASGIPFGGGYDFTKKSYSFSLTNYVQDIIDGKTQDYGTYMAPISFTDLASSNQNLFPYANSASRVVLGSFKNNNRKMRLNIYYVKSQQ